MAIRTINSLSQEKLESLTTKRLLAYLSKLHKCETCIELSDWSKEEVSDLEGIVFKSSKAWKLQYELVKTVLAERPNIK